MEKKLILVGIAIAITLYFGYAASQSPTLDSLAKVGVGVVILIGALYLL